MAGECTTSSAARAVPEAAAPKVSPSTASIAGESEAAMPIKPRRGPTSRPSRSESGEGETAGEASSDREGGKAVGEGEEDSGGEDGEREEGGGGQVGERRPEAATTADGLCPGDGRSCGRTSPRWKPHHGPTRWSCAIWRHGADDADGGSAADGTHAADTDAAAATAVSGAADGRHRPGREHCRLRRRPRRPAAAGSGPSSDPGAVADATGFRVAEHLGLRPQRLRPPRLCRGCLRHGHAAYRLWGTDGPYFPVMF